MNPFQHIYLVNFVWIYELFYICLELVQQHGQVISTQGQVESTMYREIYTELSMTKYPKLVTISK